MSGGEGKILDAPAWAGTDTKPFQPGWAGLVSEDEWRVCESAVSALRAADVNFMVGGAFGLAVYTGRLRDTKDIDFFILPEQLQSAVSALTKAGFDDYFATLPYDRGWIYRSTRDQFIVDLIFKMANRRAEVDSIWFERSHPFIVRGEQLRAIPAEELLWQKLYVLQRERCDWPDILNLLFATGRYVDWDRLFWRLEDDLPLLRGVMNVFEWLCPEEAGLLPSEVRVRLRLPEQNEEGPAEGEKHSGERTRLLDTRAWFVASTPPDRVLLI